MLQRQVTDAPHASHVNIGGEFAPSSTSLNIETTTVPRAMVVAVLTILSLPARAMGPLCHQSLLRDIQRSGKPERHTATGEYPRDLLSTIYPHVRLETDRSQYAAL